MLQLFSAEVIPRNISQSTGLLNESSVSSPIVKGEQLKGKTRKVTMTTKIDVLKQQKRSVGLKTLLGLLQSYYTTSFVSLSPSIIALFPLITHLANEETADNEEVQEVRDADLAVASSELLFQTWSGIYLSEALADLMLQTVQMTMTKSDSWRAWVSILRFLQVFVFSNIYVCELNNRPALIRSLVEKALCHSRNEVRIEAAECFTSFIHCGHQMIQRNDIDEALKLTTSERLAERHGAVLKLSSVIRAYPFTIPPMIAQLILDYCKTSTITETLRSFLRTHHDKLAERCERDSAKMITDAIYNVISPNYYV
ncbi:unnamed protein product [Anisakis simplex]|uniref:DUF3437 domain-containing protein n=1 Tax=Anisakis simplex TaxID=6269 RepID=A0A0M3J0W6_ANISI|nr:unnamed protein product [Anisakis simplex]